MRGAVLWSRWGCFTTSANTHPNNAFSNFTSDALWPPNDAPNNISTPYRYADANTAPFNAPNQQTKFDPSLSTDCGSDTMANSLVDSNNSIQFNH